LLRCLFGEPKELYWFSKKG